MEDNEAADAGSLIVLFDRAQGAGSALSGAAAAADSDALDAAAWSLLVDLYDLGAAVVPRAEDLLLRAAEVGHTAVAAQLLDWCPAAAAGPGGSTALCLAARWGHLPVVRLLLRRGADPNGGRVLRPLLFACEGGDGNAGVVGALLEAGADSGVRCAGGARLSDRLREAGSWGLLALLS
ncbi:hypothetical protein GPECTOR_5g368 [Gonium pectorale]|uniref:Uncharacterized protein n=1 Tax=Gonium pectorale TaxID=33097 RepID=A0A150GY60_GONPE|nr:hypothetical protein GPECTOR_5g368 [Gonium pectorale]|eukprot:KXZ54280.1 hypothetical protein GPECTOR_5g368 [Gonium pectorale]